jgi:predicted transposase YbfD/YdcC
MQEAIMTHPDWVLKHKIPGTEIRNIRGKYYLYSYTTVWSKEKKRPQKKTTKQIGIITEEFGLIPTGMSRKGRLPKGASKIKDDTPLDTNFLDQFEVIEDPRVEKNCLYTVSEILLVTFLAVICGAEGWQDVENYGKAKIDYLRKYLDYQNGTPSDDTIRRFFRAINTENFKKIFYKWINSIANIVDAKVIAIDGKSSRRSYDDDENMLHVVSAFATAARVVLGQEKVSNKSNEITAIPKLLELLDVKGHIVTIDAMGCQYAIADKILSKEGDYIFSLKGNQGNLHEDIKLYFNSQSTKNISSCIDNVKGHGRYETRECFICTDVQWLQEKYPHWGTINSFIKINSIREFKNSKKSTQEDRYYISSLKDATPDSFLKSIREHWGIENTLHWILDMSFNEDYSRIRKQNAPHVMAIIRHIALNLLQRGKPKRQSIKGLRKICSWDNSTLTSLVSKNARQLINC